LSIGPKMSGKTKELEVVFEGGLKVRVQPGSSVLEAARTAAAPGLERALVALVNGQPVDLSAPLMEDSSVVLIDAGHEIGLETMRHSCSHLLASAVKSLFPGAKLGIGPAVADGYYYDFQNEQPFSETDLERIEKKMREIAEADQPFRRRTMSVAEAISFFEKLEEPLKLELLREMDSTSGEVSVYSHGDFHDLCRGPHVPSTGRLKVFKLLSVAGAYWRGVESGIQLQRVYGAVFETGEELKEFLRLREEAEARDHRKLGPALDLFSLQEEAGAGLVFWHPRGTIVRGVIERFWKEEHSKRGYQLVVTPHIARAHLWERSGHMSYYRENMYLVDSPGEKYVVKPMNCPGHILIYKSRKRSYRELPLRYAELGTVYRRERSGVLHGTLRVKGFTQDDAHIFCTREQLRGEVASVLELAFFMLSAFGFAKFEIDLSVRDAAKPEKYLGSEESWRWAEAVLAEALTGAGAEFRRMEGEAVFYGPKIDIHLYDALNRKWQGPTIQVDFNFPERFDITYMAEDGKERRVVMVHRTVLGALERFLGNLIEHYAGEFPLWLSPEQSRVLTVTDASVEYGRSVAGKLEKAGLRVGSDFRSDRISAKIRDAEMFKVPYMIIVGKKEQAAGTVSVRSKKRGDMGAMAVEQLVEKMLEEVDRRI